LENQQIKGIGLPDIFRRQGNLPELLNVTDPFDGPPEKRHLHAFFGTDAGNQEQQEQEEISQVRLCYQV